MNARSRDPRRQERSLSIAEAAIIVVVAAGLVVITATAHATPGPDDIRTQTAFVAPSDTLWNLAAAHPVEGLSTARTVDLIIELNGLEDGGVIQPGTTLLVPASDSGLQLAAR